MMSTAVFAKSLRDRWLGMAIAAGTIGLFLIAGMAMYRDLDLSIYTDLPEGFRNAFGFGDAADAGGLAFGAIYGFVGALAVAGVAISIGANAIAGEERDRTIGVLLANPLSRVTVLASKGLSLVLLVTAAALVLYGFGLLAPSLLDVDVAQYDVGALVLHMALLALFFGVFALAIGCWTGNSAAGGGAAAGLLAISFLAASVLPIAGGVFDDIAKAFPWYYYDGSDPLHNGIDWLHWAILFASSTLLAGLAVFGLRRRDLKQGGSGAGLVDRLRDNPHTKRIIDRLAGSARVSRIWVMTASEHQVLLNITGMILLLMGVMMGPLYTAIDADLKDLTDQLPDAVQSLIGNVDMGTPEGWYTGENFSLVVPIALIAVTVMIGAGALAGEERRRTMSILLANPITRTRVVLEKSFAMFVYVALLVIFTFIGTALGSLLGGLDISASGIAAISLLAGLLGMVFGSLALMLSAATGRLGFATFASAAIAFVFYLANSLLPLNEDLADFAKLSPFYYYLTGDPMVNGLDWSHVGVLAAISFVLIALSVVLFNRRDLHAGN